jgi:predicted nucleotidyltransferase
MTTQQRLRNFAEEIAYPYVIQLPFFVEYHNKISILLVGSTATGLCNDNSDVDICFLCDEYVFSDISQGTDWINGRPIEIIIDNVQLHYYAISYETIEKKITEYDDITFYVYGNVVVLNDNSGLYIKVKNMIYNDEIRINRKNKAVDMLIRRNRAFKQIILKESDPILRIRVGLEIIELLLKAIALSDGNEFDMRKKFYTTALTGNKGMKMIYKLDILIDSLSKISKIENSEKSCIFMQIIDDCIKVIQH